MVQRAKLPAGMIKRETRRDLAAAADELPEIRPLSKKIVAAKLRTVSVVVSAEDRLLLRNEAIRLGVPTSKLIRLELAPLLTRLRRGKAA